MNTNGIDINIIKEAIRTRHVIHFNYLNKGEILERLVEPYALGMKENDDLCLLCFQIDKESSSDGLPDWRRFDLDKI